MSSDEELTRCVQRYRWSADEVAANPLDQVILSAAGRQASYRRLARRAGGAGVLTSIAVLCGSIAWYSHQSTLSRAAAASYGQIEGSTRAYLLHAESPQLSDPGYHEGKP